MTVQELIAVLGNLSADTEVRIGDQIELGPYSHDRVGGVWTDRPNNAGDVQYVILCAEDTNWQDEFEGDIKSDDELPLIWVPPAPIPGEMKGPAGIVLTDDNDPTPWCHQCGAMEQTNCDCLPIADNN